MKQIEKDIELSGKTEQLKMKQTKDRIIILWWIHKKVKVFKPHCNVCGEMLKGDGSLTYSYSCSCGEWEYQLSNNLWKIK